MPSKELTMKLLKEKFAVCRLEASQSIPAWVKESGFYSITKTEDELSVVCRQNNVPSGIKCEKDWRIFKIEGPLDFSLIGILAAVSTALAEQGISIFAVSTYDTDYILVKDKDTANAVKALVEEGYQIVE